jgi:hypothetical protein
MIKTLSYNWQSQLMASIVEFICRFYESHIEKNASIFRSYIEYEENNINYVIN